MKFDTDELIVEVIEEPKPEPPQQADVPEADAKQSASVEAETIVMPETPAGADAADVTDAAAVYAAEEQPPEVKAEGLTERSEAGVQPDGDVPSEAEVQPDDDVQPDTGVQPGVSAEEAAAQSVQSIAEDSQTDRFKRPVHITEPGRLPLSVAIETEGGMVSRIAEIGDMLPVECTREFSTGNISVKAVALNLYAGERPLAAQNKRIGAFKIEGIERLPVGRPVITVRFRIQADHSIRIEALDEGSLKTCIQTIESSWVPSDEEIYRMVQEAQDNLAQDNKVRERSRLLRNARECLFRADTALRLEKKEHSLENRRQIREKSKRLQQRLKKLDVLDMTELHEKAIIDAVNSLDNALR